jgi:hypothetical protein
MMRFLVPVLAVVVFTVFCCGTAQAALKEEVVGGVVDWAKGMIVVTGEAAALEKGGTFAVEKAAIADAYHKLLGTIDGIRLNSKTMVRDVTGGSKEVRDKLKEAVSKKMSVGEVKRMPDGSVIVKVYLPLYGKEGVAEVIYPSLFTKTAPAMQKPVEEEGKKK